jgi:deoxyribodipyrimidine photo-lyase
MHEPFTAKTKAELLEIVDTIDPVAYAKTCNHLVGAVTRLSPYIARGVISLPEIRERLYARHAPADCEKLVQELAWREYFQHVWWAKADGIFTELRFTRDDWRHYDLVSAVVDGATGIAVLDEAVAELYATGYLHNHNRMWLASASSNLARAHWYEMGRWLYYYLLDGDPASNFCSWQWVAGTSVNKRYSVNQALINACSGTTQTGTWLDVDRDAMLSTPTPSVLESSVPNRLVCAYPDVEPVSVTPDADVVLYTPWTLNPTFAAEGHAERILVIDTDWFERLPVSELVMDFIVRQGSAVIPNLQVHVGTIHSLALVDARSVQYEAHPTNVLWPGTGALRAQLFPAVHGYYPSFFKYWQAVQDTAG